MTLRLLEASTDDMLHEETVEFRECGPVTKVFACNELSVAPLTGGGRGRTRPREVIDVNTILPSLRCKWENRLRYA